MKLFLYKQFEMKAKKKATIRFYEELNDFLDKRNKKRDLVFYFSNQPTIKDIIESFGVPHTEVDLILVNSISVEFDYHLTPNDRISVYPKFESFDIQEITKLRKSPLRNIKFILDVHLGKLAKYLRLLGFDTIYQNNMDDPSIVNQSKTEHRIILSRDIGLLKHNKVQHGYYVRSDAPKKQIKEIIQRFDLKNSINSFSRCLECNGVLKKINKTEIIERLDPTTRKYYKTFFICNTCDKIYWKGSHYQQMAKFLREIVDIDTPMEDN